jgi:electron transfer flavoprotein alpha subunit
MKVITCIKQVPDVTDIRFDPVRRTLVREGVRLIVNPFDRPALALSAQLAGKGASTVAVTMGPPQAAEVLYEALASGIARAAHLCHPAFAGADTLATARALAAFCRREGFDLIVCGKYTVDGETAQVGPELAELLGIPHVSGVGRVTFSEDGRTLRAERETDEGHEELEVDLPCLLTAAEHLLPPVPVRKPALDEARGRPIETLAPADLGLPEAQCGAAGSPTWVAEIRPLPPLLRPPVRMLTGAPAEVALELARLLREEIRRGQAGAAPPLLPPPVADPPAGRDVMVVVERTSIGPEPLTPGTVELLGEAASLAPALRGAVVAVVIGPCPPALGDACAAAGADEVLIIDHPRHPLLAEYSSEGHAAALAHAISARRPQVVLFSSTELGRDLAPRAAARLGLGLTGDAIGLSLDEEGRLVQLKPAFGGEVVAPILSKTLPQMATVRPGIFPRRAPDPGRRARRATLALDEAPLIRTRRLHSEVTVDPQAASLAGAQVVVGVGMGIGDPAGLPALQALAAALGGSLAATRRVTDKGWLPRQIQVGLTGKVIAPALYLAIGIRGVGNHTVGIKRAGTIVAINKDEKAPIFQLATYGVVADWAEIVPPLLRALES